MTVAATDPRSELMLANYSIDYQQSELSFLRQNPADIRRQEEELVTMVDTAKRLGASKQTIDDLESLVKEQPTETALGDDEVEKLNALLEDANLAELGVSANIYGLTFKLFSRDGTVPRMDLDLINSNFKWVFDHVKTKMVGSPVFSGVVFLEHETKKNAGIALVIRESEIKIQRQTIIWEDI